MKDLKEYLSKYGVCIIVEIAAMTLLIKVRVIANFLVNTVGLTEDKAAGVISLIAVLIIIPFIYYNVIKEREDGDQA